MNRKWFRQLFRRRVLVILLLVAQAVFLIHLLVRGGRISQTLNAVLTILSLLTALHVVSKRDKAAYKTAWVFLILLFPLFGGLLYLMFHFQGPTRSLANKVRTVEAENAAQFALPGTGYDAAKERVGELFPQVRYLQDTAGFPIYDHTSVRYFSPGERLLEALLPALEQAEHYIFLEFFIVQEGHMWDPILSILKEKAARGVKVRLIYDDIGCFLLLPQNYPQQLREFGIECVRFNPFRPFLTAKQNNRDHRKIISIDGKVAYTGGINLAGEYINAIEKHGHWKDAGILVEGQAAWSFTIMFLEMWQVCTGQREDLQTYYPWSEQPCTVSGEGFVQPYADSPLDTENVGEHVYLQILNQARDYVYINTPYLIVDDSMVSALTLAAKRGVDVRIITPHRWDKWAIHMTTRSYYRDLVRAGVRVYEYEKGFMHAKTFVCDDRVATVGTTNLDFRSLYLHFECGALLFGSPAIQDIKQDFLTTIQTCRPILEENCRSNFLVHLFQEILRLFAPLM